MRSILIGRRAIALRTETRRRVAAASVEYRRLIIILMPTIIRAKKKGNIVQYLSGGSNEYHRRGIPFLTVMTANAVRAYRRRR
jgi:hypothetical protein